jgi:hypothetical protein
MRPNAKLDLKVDNLPKFRAALKAMLKQEVLVGVPEATAPRKDSKVNNALLAYVHDNGSPLAHIPRREFLRPGIKEGQDEIVRRFGAMGRATLAGDLTAVDKGLHSVGLAAQKAVRRKITVGPFTPLKPATIRARKRRHPRRKNTTITPLIDTGALRASINYVVTNK